MATSIEAQVKMTPENNIVNKGYFLLGQEEYAPESITDMNGQYLPFGEDGWEGDEAPMHDTTSVRHMFMHPSVFPGQQAWEAPMHDTTNFRYMPMHPSVSPGQQAWEVVQEDAGHGSQKHHFWASSSKKRKIGLSFILLAVICFGSVLVSRSFNQKDPDAHVVGLDSVGDVDNKVTTSAQPIGQLLRLHAQAAPSTTIPHAISTGDTSHYSEYCTSSLANLVESSGCSDCPYCFVPNIPINGVVHSICFSCSLNRVRMNASTCAAVVDLSNTRLPTQWCPAVEVTTSAQPKTLAWSTLAPAHAQAGPPTTIPQVTTSAQPTTLARSTLAPAHAQAGPPTAIPQAGNYGSEKRGGGRGGKRQGSGGDQRRHELTDLKNEEEEEEDNDKEAEKTKTGNLFTASTLSSDSTCIRDEITRETNCLCVQADRSLQNMTIDRKDNLVRQQASHCMYDCRQVFPLYTSLFLFFDVLTHMWTSVICYLPFAYLVTAWQVDGCLQQTPGSLGSWGAFMEALKFPWTLGGKCNKVDVGISPFWIMSNFGRWQAPVERAKVTAYWAPWNVIEWPWPVKQDPNFLVRLWNTFLSVVWTVTWIIWLVIWTPIAIACVLGDTFACALCLGMDLVLLICMCLLRFTMLGPKPMIANTWALISLNMPVWRVLLTLVLTPGCGVAATVVAFGTNPFRNGNPSAVIVGVVGAVVGSLVGSFSIYGMLSFILSLAMLPFWMCPTILFLLNWIPVALCTMAWWFASALLTAFWVFMMLLSCPFSFIYLPMQLFLVGTKAAMCYRADIAYVFSTIPEIWGPVLATAFIAAGLGMYVRKSTETVVFEREDQQIHPVAKRWVEKCVDDMRRNRETDARLGSRKNIEGYALIGLKYFVSTTTLGSEALLDMPSQTKYVWTDQALKTEEVTKAVRNIQVGVVVSSDALMKLSIADKLQSALDAKIIREAMYVWTDKALKTEEVTKAFKNIQVGDVVSSDDLKKLEDAGKLQSTLDAKIIRGAMYVWTDMAVKTQKVTEAFQNIQAGDVVSSDDLKKLEDDDKLQSALDAKVIREEPDLPGNLTCFKLCFKDAASTTLVSIAVAGDTSLKVVTSESFEVGDYVIIDLGNKRCEERKSIIKCDFGDPFLLDSPLQYDHAAGATVRKDQERTETCSVLLANRAELMKYLDEEPLETILAHSDRSHSMVKRGESEKNYYLNGLRVARINHMGIIFRPELKPEAPSEEEKKEPPSCKERILTILTKPIFYAKAIFPCFDNYSDVAQSITFLRTGRPFYFTLNFMGIAFNVVEGLLYNPPDAGRHWALDVVGRYFQADVIEATFQMLRMNKSTRLYYTKKTVQAHTESLMGLPILFICIFELERFKASGNKWFPFVGIFFASNGYPVVGECVQFGICCVLVIGDIGLLTSCLLSFSSILDGIGEAPQWVDEFDEAEGKGEAVSNTFSIDPWVKWLRFFECVAAIGTVGWVFTTNCMEIWNIWKLGAVMNFCTFLPQVYSARGYDMRKAEDAVLGFMITLIMSLTWGLHPYCAVWLRYLPLRGPVTANYRWAFLIHYSVRSVVLGIMWTNFLFFWPHSQERLPAFVHVWVHEVFKMRWSFSVVVPMFQSVLFAVTLVCAAFTPVLAFLTFLWNFSECAKDAADSHAQASSA